eukprot:Platyproteum_vivax@DN5339_c0_g1_i2.p1
MKNGKESEYSDDELTSATKKQRCEGNFNENSFVDRKIDNRRIASIKGLLYPQLLLEEVPCGEVAKSTILKTRQCVENVVRGVDDRLLVVVGPCSIHDVKAAMEYATRLQVEAKRLEADLVVCMRVYFEKPRTIVGWKGLINDPHLNETFDINTGLRQSRRLLADINELGVACATEFLDTMIPQYIADLISWAAIGARTAESQLHRELASGLSMPVGFKNSTAGDIKIAVEACKSSMHPHCFLSIAKQGIPGIVLSTGNRDAHLVLRGGTSGTNFDKKQVEEAVALATKLGVVPTVMIDCSHGNSQKDFRNQKKVAASVAEQITLGTKFICGVMIESHLMEGAQSVSNLSHKTPPLQQLQYGVSITDACVGWLETVDILNTLAQAVKSRRNNRK